MNDESQYFYVIRSTPDFGGYDQFGSMLGQVFVDERNLTLRTGSYEMQTFELNLPGARQRRCLPFYSENQRRYAYIYGVCQDGTVFVIGASSYDESMTQLSNDFEFMLRKIYNFCPLIVYPSVTFERQMENHIRLAGQISDLFIWPKIPS